MSIILFFIGLGLMIYGLSQHADAAAQQVSGAVYIVGGLLLMGVAMVVYQLARRRQDERARLKAEQPDVALALEKKEASDSRATLVALVLLIGLCVFIGYKWTHP